MTAGGVPDTRTCLVEAVPCVPAFSRENGTVRVLNMLQAPLVALDVGTAVTRIRFASGEVAEHPSAVRERFDGADVLRPTMRAGVVTDIAGVAGVVHTLLARRRRVWQRRPGAVVCAPTDVSRAERDALIEAVAAGGASVVAVVPEPLAAAIGAGVDVSSEYASAVIDLGDGVTDFAVIRNAAVVRSRAKRVGCSTLREAIRSWLELRHGLPGVADATLDAIVQAYCSGRGADGAVVSHASGARVPLRREDLELLLEPLIESIAMFVATTVRDLPDEMGAEVIESGLHITGGGAHLNRVVAEIERRVGLPLVRGAEPLHAVIRGAGAMLQNRRLLDGRGATG